MPKPKTALSSTQQQILKVLRRHPQGITLPQLRAELHEAGSQEQLGRRLRSLYPLFEIERSNRGTSYIYRLIRERPPSEYDPASVSSTLRATILARYGHRCQMCGRTVSEDNVKLHIDHKIPQSWNGKTVEENLWPLCSDCNEGKKNYFASFDPQTMASVLSSPSVHQRIANLLELKKGQWIDSDLIEFVANFDDYQADWQKRLRELRYFGWVIQTSKHKLERRTTSRYRLVKASPLPANPSQAAQEYERSRAARNRGTKRPNR